jgi:hypothetical protein
VCVSQLCSRGMQRALCRGGSEAKRIPCCAPMVWHVRTIACNLSRRTNHRALAQTAWQCAGMLMTGGNLELPQRTFHHRLRRSWDTHAANLKVRVLEALVKTRRCCLNQITHEYSVSVGPAPRVCLKSASIWCAPEHLSARPVRSIAIFDHDTAAGTASSCVRTAYDRSSLVLVTIPHSCHLFKFAARGARTVAAM